MQRTIVISSNLASVGYDAESSMLEVQFKNGSVYRYIGIPVSVYEGLMAASSKGSYLDSHVKKVGYPAVRIG